LNCTILKKEARRCDPFKKYRCGTGVEEADVMSTRYSKDLSNNDLDSGRELLTWWRRTSVYFLD
jgi:hypothetical protein